MPHLSLPSLTGYLRQNGHKNVFQRDLNVEAYERLLRPGNLVNYLRRAENKAKRLSQFKRIKGNLEIAAKKINHIEEAKNYLRDSLTFSKPERCRFVSEIVQSAFSLINITSQPTYLDFYDYRSSYSGNFLREVFEEECKKGIFNSFFQEEVYPYIKNLNPDLIGISINYKSQIAPSFVLAKNIKKLLKTTHVVMGGNVITRLANFLKLQKEISTFTDSFILYEGEKALLCLAECINRKKNLRHVPNLIFWENGNVVETDISLSTNIDDLPTPDFNGLPLGLYLSPGPVIPLLTSRGCYWRRCAFCSHYFSYGDSYKERELGKVIQDIVNLQKQCNTNAFFFVDEGIPPKRLKQISLRIAEKNLDLRWTAEVRMEKDLIIGNTLNVIKKSGCRMLQYGFESASQKILSLMDKGTNPEIAKNILIKAHDAGIINYVMFMVGFPGENKKDAELTIKFFKNNHKYIHILAGGRFRLERHSGVYKNPKAYGISLRDNKGNTGFPLELEYRYEEGLLLTEKQIGILLHNNILEGYRKRGLIYPIYDRVHFLFAPRNLLTSYPD